MEQDGLTYYMVAMMAGLVVLAILSIPKYDDEKDTDCGYHLPSIRTVLKRILFAANKCYHWCVERARRGTDHPR